MSILESMTRAVQGKVVGALAMAQFARHLRNWREVWAAYRVGGAIPPMEVRGGPTLYSGPGDDAIGLFRELFVDRSYTTGFYSPQDGDVVIDIGANIGWFALFLRSAADVRVHCFEPAPETRRRLDRNVATNGFGASIDVYPEAVGSGPGMLRRRTAAVSAHGWAFPSEFAPDDVVDDVPTIGLPEAMARAGGGPIALLKVDVEGGEIEVFDGATPTDLARVRMAAVEYHDLFRPGCRERVRAALSAAGFRLLPDRVESEGLGMIRGIRG